MLIQEFVQRLLAHMGVEGAEVVVEESDMIFVQITVSEEESGLLIGYHGEVLASLQKVLQLVYHEHDEDKKIVVNINDYKQRREAQLREMTTKIAQRVLETGQTYIFSFLPANERLVIHKIVVETPEFSRLESVSEGEGNQRRLQIRVKQDED